MVFLLLSIIQSRTHNLLFLCLVLFLSSLINISPFQFASCQSTSTTTIVDNNVTMSDDPNSTYTRFPPSARLVTDSNTSQYYTVPAQEGVPKGTIVLATVGAFASAASFVIIYLKSKSNKREDDVDPRLTSSIQIVIPLSLPNKLKEHGDERYFGDDNYLRGEDKLTVARKSKSDKNAAKKTSEVRNDSQLTNPFLSSPNVDEKTNNVKTAVARTRPSAKNDDDDDFVDEDDDGDNDSRQHERMSAGTSSSDESKNESKNTTIKKESVHQTNASSYQPPLGQERGEQQHSSSSDVGEYL